MNVHAYNEVSNYPDTSKFLLGHIVVWEDDGKRDVGVVDGIGRDVLLVRFWMVGAEKLFDHRTSVWPVDLKVIGYIKGWGWPA